MRKILLLAFAFSFQLFFLQSITLNKVDKINENKDKFFYQIKDTVNSEFLGEILINGFSNDDVKVFEEIYKKSKQIGANTFSLKAIENVDGSFASFNPSYYILNLYYTNADKIFLEENVAYFITSSDKNQKIKVDNDNVVMHPRSYIRLILKNDVILSVSTRNILGSAVRLTGKEGQPSLYFSLSGFKVRSNDDLYGGINFKSGDITGLEKSFGMFLTTIYTKENIH